MDNNNKIIEYLNQNNISFDSLKQIIKNNKDIEKEEINFVKYKTTTNNKHYTLNVIAYFSNGNDIIKITTFHDIKHMIYNKNENDENELTTSIIIPGLKKCEKKQMYLDESNTEVIKKGEINSKLTFKNKSIQYSIIFELENNSNIIQHNDNNNIIYNTNIPFNRNSFIDLNPFKGIPIDYNCSIGNITENNSTNILVRLSTNNNNNNNNDITNNTPGLFQISYPISQNLHQDYLNNQKPKQQQQQKQQSQNNKGKKQNSNQNKQQQQQQKQKEQKIENIEENEKESQFDKFNNLYRIDNTYKQQLNELNQKVQDLQYKLKTTQIQISIMESNSITNKNIIDQEILNKIKLNLFSQEHSIKFEINSFIDDIKLLEQQIKLISHNIIKSNESSSINGNGGDNNKTLVTENKSKDDLIKFWNDYGEIYLKIKNEISDIGLCQYDNFILKIKEIFSKNMKNSNLVKFSAFCG
ncbi:hypothetical protein DDB_G0285749 [Dictyostelium discoideum AX4]|uniref:Uncharacterized protein n=1 Tax=Dictyostelium discoideum TaxID=44689 RepID=Q54N29_DICDI|nr:hypothetical protein DDB_G0285749 [Dictyostelium discoideum AX4]EAL64712.1 hypothetical protein DDB_G0285749 [Dictyostelium discoideum AX4]|eukprot:XP_638114.1 hypothetical protein DDB_G0285749 [Dictyostelium discoideum AX4]